MEHELNPAKIVGECSQCGYLYDICRNGFFCPACGSTGHPRGARLVTEQEAQAYGSEARRRLCTALDNFHKQTETMLEAMPGELKDIAELETLYALEDKRP